MKQREETVQHVNAVLHIHNPAPGAPPFQFTPLVYILYGTLGNSAHAIDQQLAESSADRSSMSVGLCKRIALETLSVVTVHSTSAHIIRSRRPVQTL